MTRTDCDIVERNKTDGSGFDDDGWSLYHKLCRTRFDMFLLVCWFFVALAFTSTQAFLFMILFWLIDPTVVPNIFSAVGFAFVWLVYWPSRNPPPDIQSEIMP